MIEEDGEQSWLSRDLGDVSRWSPEYADRIDNVDDLGAMLALDAIIANEDRHVDNILVVDAEGGLVAWAIDHGNAKVAVFSDFATLGLEPCDTSRLAGGLPLPSMIAGARTAAARASLLDRVFFDALVSEAVQRDALEARSALETLARRALAAPALVEEYIHRLGVR